MASAVAISEAVKRGSIDMGCCVRRRVGSPDTCTHCAQELQADLASRAGHFVQCQPSSQLAAALVAVAAKHAEAGTDIYAKGGKDGYLVIGWHRQLCTRCGQVVSGPDGVQAHACRGPPTPPSPPPLYCQPATRRGGVGWRCLRCTSRLRSPDLARHLYVCPRVSAACASKLEFAALQEANVRGSRGLLRQPPHAAYG